MQHTFDGSKFTAQGRRSLHRRSVPQDSPGGAVRYACPLPVFQHCFLTRPVIKIVFPTATSISGQIQRYMDTSDGLTANAGAFD